MFNKKAKIAVLGCGNMAQALIESMAQFENLPDFYYYTPSMTKALLLSEKVPGIVCAKISEIPKCDYYLIACKPNQVDALSLEFNNSHNANGGIIISILAGVTTDYLSQIFSNKKIIRMMPNTPALAQEGVIAIFFTEKIAKDEQDYIKKIFSFGSKIYEFQNEKDVDIITPFSGSGPAYIFEFARIFSDKLIRYGIDKDIAKEIIDNTFYGAACLMKSSDCDHETLRDNVTSKNGVTAKALEVLSSKDISNIFEKAIDQAYQRTLELKK